MRHWTVFTRERNFSLWESESETERLLSALLKLKVFQSFPSKLCLEVEFEPYTVRVVFCPWLSRVAVVGFELLQLNIHNEVHRLCAFIKVLLFTVILRNQSRRGFRFLCWPSKLVNVFGYCRISNFLDHVDLGEYVVNGQLEAYSCKNCFHSGCNCFVPLFHCQTGHLPVSCNCFGPVFLFF